MLKRRVVVTGIGLITPLGLDVDTTWSGILKGKSGVTQASFEGLENNASRISACVPDFDPASCMSHKLIRKTDVFIQYGFAAAKQANADAALVIPPELSHRYGVAVGSGIGGLPLMETTDLGMLKNGPRRVSPDVYTGGHHHQYVSRSFIDRIRYERP